MYDHIDNENWGKYYLNPAMNHWLTQNIGLQFDKWDTRKVNHTDAEPVFFRGRNDALKFVKFLKSLINNIYLEKSS